MRNPPYLRFQRTPPSRESSRMTAALRELVADAVGRREIPAFSRGLPFGHQALRFQRRRVRRNLGRCRARGVSPRRRRGEQRKSRRTFRASASTGAASPWRNSPRSMAIFTSRTRSKIAASACAVFRSSARAAVEIFAAPSRRDSPSRATRPPEISRTERARQMSAGAPPNWPRPADFPA